MAAHDDQPKVPSIRGRRHRPPWRSAQDFHLDATLIEAQRKLGCHLVELLLAKRAHRILDLLGEVIVNRVNQHQPDPQLGGKRRGPASRQIRAFGQVVSDDDLLFPLARLGC